MREFIQLAVFVVACTCLWLGGWFAGQKNLAFDCGYKYSFTVNGQEFACVPTPSSAREGK